MCAVAIHAPPIHTPTKVEDPKRVQMPGHWEDDPESIQLEAEQPIEEGPGQPSQSQSEKDPELFRYNPPAALTELANVTSETIVLIVRSSVEHVFQQVEAERRTQEEANASELAPDTDDPTQQPTPGSTTGKEPDLTPGVSLTQQPTTSSHSASSDSQSWSDEQHRGQRRHRFGFRRIFQHIVEKGESSSSSSASASFDLSSLPAYIHRIPPPTSSTAPSTPSTFTQLVYKHIKPSATPSAGSTSEPETIECTSCFDDLTPSTTIKTPCQHPYCAPCFQQLISTALESESQWPPKCCLTPIPFRTISKHARPDILKRYRDRDAEFKVPAANRIYCSTPDCGTWIRKVDKANKTARCTAGHTMCILCRGAPHPLDTPCPQDRDRQVVDMLAEEEGWRRCSKCAVLVEHREACQHMTCRCGNQFCYVCGAQWRTCVCTSDMLVGIKARAAKKREERLKKEKEEDEWLGEALRLIEEYERETREMEERRRAERRREREAERARREEERVVALGVKYGELREVLERVNEMQKALVRCAQDREGEEAKVQEAEEIEQLVRRQEVELQELRTVLDVKLTDRELEWDRDYRVRVVYEKRVEDEYAAALRAFWSDKTGGGVYAGEALRAYMAQNDQRWDFWNSTRESDLQKLRYEHEEELAIRKEIMETMRLRQQEELGERQVEREARFAAERKWFELVVAERTRMLAEIETVDRESGGVDEEPISEDDGLELTPFDDGGDRWALREVKSGKAVLSQGGSYGRDRPEWPLKSVAK
ncbi:hypothetical protein B0T16DRAFT_385984 [Cercophora newfieldiana]|uniref:RBR-type E3 ubiquitin transferase n=1 Tax=Cercophora newfieldiana TaxID=92897 RepID=A0AA39YSZ8_9PEZI|nr:hypothetical protein B0T16DRAFT_385984 [Cercophora newfieldiana]